MNKNPLLSLRGTPFNTPPFAEIKNKDFLPAIKDLIVKSKNEIELIVSSTSPPNFSNTIEELEKSGKELDRATSVFFNLNSAETNDEIQSIARDVSPFFQNFQTTSF